MPKQYILEKLNKLSPGPLISLSLCLQYEYKGNKNKGQKNILKNLIPLVMDECSKRGIDSVAIESSVYFNTLAEARKKEKNIAHELIPLYLSINDWRSLKSFYSNRSQ
jgi:uncharacterized circularly permuted ATP-grasp superfamily protein